jgi:hypothetical protein
MKGFLTLLALTVAFTATSQERATIKRLKKNKQICKAFAEQSIQEISDGVLLVRLNFRQKQIDYLNNQKDSSTANQVKKRAMNVNKKIATAFKEKFDFCTVYFFKMSDSKYLKNQQFDSLTFYDHSFNEIDSSKLEVDNYLIGEFSRIKQDTSYYYDENLIDTSKEKPKQKTYYGGSKNGREAFIIMDRQFQQIQKPFPYFAGLQAVLSEGTRFKKALELINQKLHSYSSQVGTKEE